MPKPWATAPDLQYFPTPPCPHCAANASHPLQHVTPPPLLRDATARLTAEASSHSVLISLEGTVEGLTTISARGLQAEISFSDGNSDTPYVSRRGVE